MNPTITNTTNPVRERCDNCLFWRREASAFRGQCRRYPPVPLSAMNSYYAESNQDNWCGEYKQRPPTEAPAPEVPAKGSARKRA